MTRFPWLVTIHRRNRTNLTFSETSLEKARRTATMLVGGRTWKAVVSNTHDPDFQAETYYEKPTQATLDFVRKNPDNVVFIMFEGICPTCLLSVVENDRGFTDDQEYRKLKCPQGHAHEIYQTAGYDWVADGDAERRFQDWVNQLAVPAGE